jgi:hypothetical protein
MKRKFGLRADLACAEAASENATGAAAKPASAERRVIRDGI